MIPIPLLAQMLLATRSFARPQGDPNSQKVQLKTDVAGLHPSSNPSYFVGSSVATSYGKPVINGAGRGQWPDQATGYSYQLFTNNTLQRDTWAWIFADSALAGIYIPSSYQGNETEYAIEASWAFLDLNTIASAQLNDITRVAYNVESLPSEPLLEGKASFQEVKYYTTSYIGRAFDSSKPSYIIVG